MVQNIVRVRTSTLKYKTKEEEKEKRTERREEKRRRERSSTKWSSPAAWREQKIKKGKREEKRNF